MTLSAWQTHWSFLIIYTVWAQNPVLTLAYKILAPPSLSCLAFSACPLNFRHSDLITDVQIANSFLPQGFCLIVLPAWNADL